MTGKEHGVMMGEEIIRQNSLVLYRHRPARVLKVASRIEIELEDGNQAKVRIKDIQLLHPGPLATIKGLVRIRGEVELAWELLCNELERVLSISELAELIYGVYTPETAWASWEQVEDGLYFQGTPTSVRVCSPEEVQQEKDSRQAEAQQAQRWNDFLERVSQGKVEPEHDQDFLREVEDFAYGRRANCRLLRELKRGERPENAHALLLDLGYWDRHINPYPTRLGFAVISPEFVLPALPHEERLDLTHLETYAIDDRDNQDPDDALSLEYVQFDGGSHFHSARLWVHVADAAALIEPGSPSDLEACSRGATLYLPEGNIPMLPDQAVERLGMGLQKLSPALSFGIQLDAMGEITSFEIKPSWVKVIRLSYEEAEARLEAEPLKGLLQITDVYRTRRMVNGALFIDLPEVIVRLVDQQVLIRPVPNLRSRGLVREAMIMAGEAAARFAIQNRLPFPFAIQEAPEGVVPPFASNSDSSPAESATPKEIIDRHNAGKKDKAKEGIPSPDELVRHYNMRRSLKRSQVSGIPGPHSGVGLPAYSRVTSPLRRYLDLVAHQQLRAFLKNGQFLNEGKILERLGASEAISSRVNQAEALASRHWTLVYLSQNPHWRGEGVIVEKTGIRNRVIIPDLMLEFPLSQNVDLPLGTTLSLLSPKVNLPELEVYFQYEPYHP